MFVFQTEIASANRIRDTVEHPNRFTFGGVIVEHRQIAP